MKQGFPLPFFLYGTSFTVLQDVTINSHHKVKRNADVCKRGCVAAEKTRRLRNRPSALDPGIAIYHPRCLEGAPPFYGRIPWLWTYCALTDESTKLILARSPRVPLSIVDGKMNVVRDLRFPDSSTTPVNPLLSCGAHNVSPNEVSVLQNLISKTKKTQRRNNLWIKYASTVLWSPVVLRFRVPVRTILEDIVTMLSTISFATTKLDDVGVAKHNLINLLSTLSPTAAFVTCNLSPWFPCETLPYHPFRVIYFPRHGLVPVFWSYRAGGPPTPTTGILGACLARALRVRARTILFPAHLAVRPYRRVLVRCPRVQSDERGVDHLRSSLHNERSTDAVHSFEGTRASRSFKATRGSRSRRSRPTAAGIRKRYDSLRWNFRSHGQARQFRWA